MIGYASFTPADTSDVLTNVVANTTALLVAAEDANIDPRAIEALRRINPPYVQFRCATVSTVIEKYGLDARDVYSCLVAASDAYSEE